MLCAPALCADCSSMLYVSDRLLMVMLAPSPLLQSYARTSASPQHLHAAAVARGLLFGLAQRREEQRITRQVGPRNHFNSTAVLRPPGSGAWAAGC
jgi:hypothetical protein